MLFERYIRAVGVALGFVCLAGLVPVILRARDTYFVVSGEWSNVLSMPALVFGAVFAAFSAVVAIKRLRRSSHPVGQSLVRRVSFCVVFVGIVATLAHQAFITTLPMIHARVVGGSKSMAFFVKSPNYVGTWGCPRASLLADRPVFADVLCNVPPDVRVILQPGDQLQVTGIGSSAGVFYTTVSLFP